MQCGEEILTSDLSVNSFIMVVYERIFLFLKFSRNFMSKAGLKNVIIKLLTHQLEVSALPAGCNGYFFHKRINSVIVILEIPQLVYPSYLVY